MVTMEKILQTMNSWQSGEVIAVRRKKCSGASSRPSAELAGNDWQAALKIFANQTTIHLAGFVLNRFLIMRSRNFLWALLNFAKFPWHL